MTAPGNPYSDAHLLIVDDQEPMVTLLETILRAAGYSHVKGTSDPAQALPLYLDFQPDLILLDLQMPRVNGFAVMEQLRERIPTGMYLPIIVLTADTRR